jgi:hypothetical protein
MKSIFRVIAGAVRRFLGLDEQLERLRHYEETASLLLGELLSRENQRLECSELTAYEYRVFSQWGEDGIIDAIVSRVPMPKVFVEFGVESFDEANCRLLLETRRWSGLVIDGSSQHISRIRSRPYYWRNSLTAVREFITKDNINSILSRGCPNKIGILSIDIDGVDYYILESIQAVDACLVICEYNALLGGDRAISVPYSPTFVRSSVHFSNLYFGASLPAFCFLLGQRGYSLIGTNSARTNAFFLKTELVTAPFQKVINLDGLCTPSVRESKDRRGNLTFLSPDAALNLIRGLPVVNVITNGIEPL